jgi:hypothetical protein
MVLDLDETLVCGAAMSDYKLCPTVNHVMECVGEDSIIQIPNDLYYYLHNGGKESLQYVMELTDHN